MLTPDGPKVPELKCRCLNLEALAISLALQRPAMVVV